MAAGADESVLEGVLEKIVFQNQSTQWTVARIAPDGGGVPVTAVGSLAGLRPGASLRLEGAWVEDPRFGRQFRVDSYRTRSPETVLGIERYLGSGLVPGIGPELAKRIVARFGLKTLEVIGGAPERLVEVEGIGQARASAIARAWGEQKEIQDVMIFLRGHGVSTAYAARILRRYGADAVAVVRKNPYRLALDIWGIGFKTADAIAQNLGIEPTAPERLEAGLIHVLGDLTEEGHLHVPAEQALARAEELLGAGRDLLEAAVERLVGSNLLVREELGARGPCLALPWAYEAERDAAAALARLVASPARPLAVDAEAALAAFERQSELALAGEQRRAVLAAVRDKCVVITGGPGVGKTTIVRAIATLFAAGERRAALAAPTGRAAKRLSESTGRPALTLHRLLEFQPQRGDFGRNRERPLEVDAVVVDETSMVDVPLLRSLVVALPPQARLILVGDVDQLPSVGPGAVLADVIASGAATVVRLTEIFRQAARSRIVVNAHRVNQGQAPELAAARAADSDFYFVERDDPVAARATIVELVAERIPRRFGFDPVTEIQVLAPMHRGELGTGALNQALAERLNPAGPGAPALSRGERTFRAGDKVMQIRNDYEREVYNGDTGVVRSVDPEAGALAVETLDGRRVEYQRSDLDKLVHAFAISVHKSQGSEYPAVVIPLATQHYMMLQRNLLYTAMTRGKELVVLIGSKRAVHMAVRNQAQGARFTWLAERLRRR